MRFGGDVADALPNGRQKAKAPVTLKTANGLTTIDEVARIEVPQLSEKVALRLVLLT